MKAGADALKGRAEPWFRGPPPCDNSTWMADLSDELSVSEVFIPGTHDSAAGGVSDIGAFAECQSWTLSEQLESGIRAFDLRACQDGEAMRFFHGRGGIIDHRRS